MYKEIKIRFKDCSIYCTSVNISTGNKIKELSSKIVETLSLFTSSPELFPCPQADNSISPELYFSLETEILSLKEYIKVVQEDIYNISIESLQIQKSIITWNDFEELCLEYKIPVTEAETVALILRNQGIIHHYRDVPEGEDSFSNLVFLQADL